MRYRNQIRIHALIIRGNEGFNAIGNRKRGRFVIGKAGRNPNGIGVNFVKSRRQRVANHDGVAIDRKINRVGADVRDANQRGAARHVGLGRGQVNLIKICLGCACRKCRQ